MAAAAAAAAAAGVYGTSPYGAAGAYSPAAAWNVALKGTSPASFLPRYWLPGVASPNGHFPLAPLNLTQAGVNPVQAAGCEEKSLLYSALQRQSPLTTPADTRSESVAKEEKTILDLRIKVDQDNSN